MEAISISHQAATLSPIALFMQADIVVKCVMIGLILASIWTWAIIIGHVLKMGKVAKENDRFERDFWKAEDIEKYHDAYGRANLPSARVFAAGVAEWRRSTANPKMDREGTRQRLATAMGSAVANEVDKMSDRLNVLATIGSVGPFVGLFGTVWGIMNAFIGISQAQTTNLAVVAPGIAEALLATAMGLVAAIPAVVIYNVFARSIAGYRQILADASAGVERLVSRDLDFRTVPPATALAAE